MHLFVHTFHGQGRAHSVTQHNVMLHPTMHLPCIYCYIVYLYKCIIERNKVVETWYSQ